MAATAVKVITRWGETYRYQGCWMASKANGDLTIINRSDDKPRCMFKAHQLGEARLVEAATQDVVYPERGDLYVGPYGIEVETYEQWSV